jgi:hypothetical protein
MALEPISGFRTSKVSFTHNKVNIWRLAVVHRYVIVKPVNSIRDT